MVLPLIAQSAGNFWVRMLDFALLYVLLALGLNIVVGYAGLLDLGYVAFYAVGAYTFALLSLNFDLSFWICLPLAGLLAGSFGVLLGFPVLRLRGDYLAIVTLAFGEIIRLVIINWQSLTGGPNGVTGIPRPTLFGIPLTPGDDGLAAMLGIEFSPTHRIVFLFYLILALALLTNWVTIRLRRLPIGRAWEALREDEVAVLNQACGDVPFRFVCQDAGDVDGTFDHVWIVSVLNDPERFPELSALSYGRANPVLFDVAAFTKEHETVVALAAHCLRKLQLPGLVTTSTEEINWITDWCLRRNISCVVEPKSYPTAAVEDPLCLIRIGESTKTRR